MTTGEKIEKLAKSRGLNIKQLAVSAGVNYSTLYSIIKRKSSFANMDLIKKVSKVLGVEPDLLLDNMACIGYADLTEAELLIFNTINAMSSVYHGKEKEDFLYLLNSIIETNADLIDTIFNKLERS